MRPDGDVGGRIVVIGIGHRDRGDDGIGPAIVDEVAAREIGVRTVVREGDLADLLTEWGPDDAVVIVDALRSDRLPGEIVEIDPEDQGSSPGTSTHGVGVAFGVELARRLGRQPGRLVVLAVTGQHFDLGPMSDALLTALPRLTDEVAGRLDDLR